MLNRAILYVAIVFITSSVASAQRTEITISFSEQFFDTVIDAMFQHGGPPEFSIGSNTPPSLNAPVPDRERTTLAVSYPYSFIPESEWGKFAPRAKCKESIQLLRELTGVRTAVRFRDGKILAPLAFTGNYNPPLVGCVPFSGWAETNLELEFDEAGQRLVARAKVLNVSLAGTGGVGGTVIARLVQSSIDRKINPIEIFRLDKVSFILPIQNSGKLSMKAVGVRHTIENGVMQVHIAYDLIKG